MGINVVFRGRLYHFESDVDLDEILEKHANNQKATCLVDGIKYDNELPGIELEGIEGAYM